LSFVDFPPDLAEAVYSLGFRPRPFEIKALEAIATGKAKTVDYEDWYGNSVIVAKGVD